MDCPKCLGKLSKVEIKAHEVFDTISVKQGAATTLEVDQCFVCNGVWFDLGELEKYLSKKLVVLDSPKIYSDIMAHLDAKVGKCPQCGVDMVKKAAPLAKGITMDFCEKCQGIWLDTAEIDRIEKKNFTLVERIAFVIKSLSRKKE